MPDGSGLIMKRFLPSKLSDEIEERVIVRMNRDGRMVDLLPGDEPIVLGKLRRILFEKDKLWYTCAFGGSEVALFGDGLPQHGFPTVSPDEKQVAFMRFAEGHLPVLTVYDVANPKKPRPIEVPGMVTGPTWK